MRRYLRWIIGLVDSDTLPLNVSREMLQMHSSLKTIKKKLVRKALDMIRKIADSQTEVLPRQLLTSLTYTPIMLKYVKPSSWQRQPT